jgi:hypothetical protein
MRRVKENCDSDDAGYRFRQQPQILVDQVESDAGQTRYIATGPRQASDETGRNGIGNIHHDDRNRLCRFLGRQGTICGSRDQDIYFAPDQLCRQRGELVAQLPRHVVDGDVLPILIAERAQPLVERVIERRIPEKPDLRHFSNLLRADDNRRGENCSQTSDESAAVHSIT